MKKEDIKNLVNTLEGWGFKVIGLEPLGNERLAVDIAVGGYLRSLTFVLKNGVWDVE